MTLLNNAVDGFNWFYSQWWGYGIIILGLFFAAVEASKDAIWAYKDSNRQIFSKEFSTAAICSALLFWSIFFTH